MIEDRGILVEDQGVVIWGSRNVDWGLRCGNQGSRCGDRGLWCYIVILGSHFCPQQHSIMVQSTTCRSSSIRSSSSLLNSLIQRYQKSDRVLWSPPAGRWTNQHIELQMLTALWIPCMCIGRVTVVSALQGPRWGSPQLLYHGCKLDCFIWGWSPCLIALSYCVFFTRSWQYSRTFCAI